MVELQVAEPALVEVSVLHEDGSPAEGVRVGAEVLTAEVAEKGWGHAGSALEIELRLAPVGR